MRRTQGLRDYHHIRVVTLTVGQLSTVEMPLACMYRVVISAVGAGASLRYRGVKELATNEGGADPTDTGALNATYCATLAATRTDSGWIDAQPSAVRLEAVVGTVTFFVQWTSRIKPTIA